MIPNDVLKLLRLIAAMGALSVLGCGIASVDNGGSTGTEVSALSGSVVDQNGIPMSQAVVRLRPADFLSDSANSETYLASHTMLDTITGSDGKFSFSELLPDSYTVEIASDDTLGSCTGLRIGEEQAAIILPPLTAVPPAEITGQAQVAVYGPDIPIIVQVYGLERSVPVDTQFGDFSVKVPCGINGSRHHLHFSAYDTAASGELAVYDIILDVVPGEQWEAGSFNLRLPPPPPCPNGACDSGVVRFLLTVTGNDPVTLDSVIKTENGRIVELNLRGKDLSKGIPFDVNKLAELRLLDLGETGLPYMFPGIGLMSRLETVRLDGNKLQYFTSAIENLKNLRELDLSDNELNFLSPTVINCTSITMLNVSNNRLCVVDSSMGAWIDQFDPDWRTDQRCDFPQFTGYYFKPY